MSTPVTTAQRELVARFQGIERRYEGSDAGEKAALRELRKEFPLLDLGKLRALEARIDAEDAVLRKAEADRLAAEREAAEARRQALAAENAAITAKAQASREAERSPAEKAWHAVEVEAQEAKAAYLATCQLVLTRSAGYEISYQRDAAGWVTEWGDEYGYSSQDEAEAEAAAQAVRDAHPAEAAALAAQHAAERAERDAAAAVERAARAAVIDAANAGCAAAVAAIQPLLADGETVEREYSYWHLACYRRTRADGSSSFIGMIAPDRLTPAGVEQFRRSADAQDAAAAQKSAEAAAKAEAEAKAAAERAERDAANAKTLADILSAHGLRASDGWRLAMFQHKGQYQAILPLGRKGKGGDLLATIREIAHKTRGYRRITADEAKKLIAMWL